MFSGERSIKISTSSVVRTKPINATATPPATMNLTSARARLSNNLSYGVSIIGGAKQPEVRRKNVELIKLVPDIAPLFLADDLLQMLGRLSIGHGYFTSASFFRSTRLSQSCRSFESWPWVSICRT